MPKQTQIKPAKMSKADTVKAQRKSAVYHKPMEEIKARSDRNLEILGMKKRDASRKGKK